MKKIITSVLILMMIAPKFSYAMEKINYDKAFEKAIDNNLQLERTKKTLDEIDEKLTKGISLQDLSSIPNVDSYTQTMSIIMHSLQYQGLIDNEKATKMTYSAQKDAIGLSIKNSFLKIEYLEKNSLLLDEKINNALDNLTSSQVKYKYGLISKIDLENQELEIEKLKNQKKENDLQLDIQYKNLNHITGTKKISSIEYITINYTPLSSLNMSKDLVISRAISESANIFLQNASILALQQRIKYDLLDKSQTSLPNSEEEINIAIKDLNLRISKQNIENTVLETANNIENIQISLNNINSQIQNLEKQEKNMKKMSELGMITKLELENFALKIKELKMQEINLKNNHYILIQRYNKPYLLSLMGE